MKLIAVEKFEKLDIEALQEASHHLRDAVKKEKRQLDAVTRDDPENPIISRMAESLQRLEQVNQLIHLRIGEILLQVEMENVAAERLQYYNKSVA